MSKDTKYENKKIVSIRKNNCCDMYITLEDGTCIHIEGGNGGEIEYKITSGDTTIKRLKEELKQASISMERYKEEFDYLKKELEKIGVRDYE